MLVLARLVLLGLIGNFWKTVADAAKETTFWCTGLNFLCAPTSKSMVSNSSSYDILDCLAFKNHSFCHANVARSTLFRAQRDQYNAEQTSQVRRDPTGAGMRDICSAQRSSREDTSLPGAWAVTYLPWPHLPVVHLLPAMVRQRVGPKRLEFLQEFHHAFQGSRDYWLFIGLSPPPLRGPPKEVIEEIRRIIREYSWITIFGFIKCCAAAQRPPPPAPYTPSATLSPIPPATARRACSPLQFAIDQMTK